MDKFEILLIAVNLVAIIWYFGAYKRLKDYPGELRIGMVSTAIMCIMLMWSVQLITRDDAYQDGFKDGQITAIRGLIDYELEYQADSTRIWVKIQEVEKEK